jgi:hypothetical protein
VYDLRPLLPGTAPGDPLDDAFDALLARLTAEVAPDSWRDRGGNVGAARQVYDRVAVITQARETHRLIRQWLDARLAEARAPVGRGR